MTAPFGGPGGPVNLIQFSELVVGQNSPLGYPDVANRPLEQVFTASGVAWQTVNQGFVGFSLVGHLHHVADIVDFPTIPSGGGGSTTNQIAIFTSKANMIANTTSAVNAFAFCSEDNQIYMWTGTAWALRFDRENQIINVSAYGSFADGTAHLILPSDIANHAGIWKGTYVAGTDTWDFVALQESIYAAYGGPLNWNGNSTGLNRAVYIPSGTYVINRPLTLNYTQGAWIFGAGEVSTYIQSTNQVQGFGTATVLQCNGVSFSRFENLQLAQHPSFPVSASALVVMQYDGTQPPNGYNAAFQGNKFFNIYFNGNGQFSPSDPNYANQMHIGYGIMISPLVGLGTSQGSENMFYSCHWIWCEIGYFQDNFNALQNGFIGGNMENCRLSGIRAQEGAVTVYNMGFQNDPAGAIGSNNRAGQQINYGGCDIVINNSAVDASLIMNCRSQSFNFIQSGAGHRMTAIGCNIVPVVNTWKGSTTYIANDIVTGAQSIPANYDGALWKVLVGGTSSGTEPNWLNGRGGLNPPQIVDGGVTWVLLSNAAIAGDQGQSIINCELPYCLLNTSGVPQFLVDGCQFTRVDFLPYGSIWNTTTTQFTIRNCVVQTSIANQAGGSQAFQWGVGTPSSFHWNPIYLSPQSALLFRAPGSEVGFDYGDLNFNIIGMYGWLGQRTPSGTNINGVDTVISGGLSTGSGTGGYVRLKACPTGTAGTAVNSPIDIFSGTPTAIKVGVSASPIINNSQVDYSCSPGTIVATAGSNFFTQTNSFYGILPGDIVEPSFTGQALPAGVIQQATATASDKVRFDLLNQSNASQAITAGRVRYAVIRRPAVTGITPQSAANDIAQLQTDMGGAGSFLAMYDSRVQVTGTNPVTAWNDIAGSGGGKGPTLVNTGSPVFNSSLNVIQTIGVTGIQTLSNSVASAQLDFSGTRTILFGFSLSKDTSTDIVFSLTQNASNYIQFYIGGGVGTTWFPSLNNAVGGVTQTTVSVPAVIAQNLSPIVIIAGYLSLTATTCAMTVFDQGTVSQSTSAFPAGSNTLVIGNSSITNSLTTSFAHWALMSTAPTADQLTAYRSWCIAKHNAVTQ
jgi:hypothetical protein